MLAKLLAGAFGLIFVGKMFFKPQLKAVGRWLEAAVNAMLIAIALVWTVQLLLYFLRS
ncbi:MAG: hypothetical protein SFV15_15575 [Polyangiaceae bacterium]|nr:hypothetical protein [Polyangiaceae bacterium]